MKRTVDDIDVRGKRVLVRLDLNVPLDAKQRVTDDRRIREAVPTVAKLIDGGGRLVLISHLGRPEESAGDRRKYSLAPVAVVLGELLGRRVRFVNDCVGEDVRAAVSDLMDGDICLLDNLRFHEAETIKDKKAAGDATLRERKESFASQLASLADAYVNDAFGTCHRDNASMLTVPRLMRGRPRVVGYLVQRELRFLGEALSDPKRPFVCIIGGAKVSDKLGVIRALLGKCDTLLIGGAMAYTFLAAEGVQTGESLVEPELFDTAREVRSEAGDRLMLPVDSVVATALDKGVDTRISGDGVPEDLMGLDIGPRTIDRFSAVIRHAHTVFWNGPMGVFEMPPFDAGTLAIATAVAGVADRGGTAIVGGGDSAAAVDRAGLANRMTHISTGGGAALEFLEGKRFAPIDELDDA